MKATRLTRNATTLFLAAGLAVSMTTGAVPAGASDRAKHTLSAPTVLVATTTTLKTSKPVALNGAAGKVTATVKRAGHSSMTPTGSVDFLVDGDWWWTAPVDERGHATLAFSDLGAGTFVITADYSGDANFTASSGGPLTQTILPNAPTAGLSFTPSTVAPGGTSRLVVSATNNTPKAMYGVALGIILTMNVSVVSQPQGGSCRRSGSVLYCLVSVPKGKTRQLVLDAYAPTTPGDYTMNAYARNIDTMDETAASATLTVQ